MKSTSRTYTLSIEKHPGGYLAYFPALPGCNTWAKTYENAIKNAKEAISLYLDTLMAHGDDLPEETNYARPVSLSLTVRVPLTLPTRR